MDSPLRRVALQHRRVAANQRMLSRLESIREDLRAKAGSAAAAQLIQLNLETTRIVQRALELALARLTVERLRLREAREDALARHGIPSLR